VTLSACDPSSRSRARAGGRVVPVRRLRVTAGGLSAKKSPPFVRGSAGTSAHLRIWPSLARGPFRCLKPCKPESQYVSSRISELRARIRFNAECRVAMHASHRATITWPSESEFTTDHFTDRLARPPADGCACQCGLRESRRLRHVFLRALVVWCGYKPVG
jgi:hypothetical protein